MFIVATRSKCLPAAESDLGAEKIRFKRMTENFFVSLRGLTERLTWRPLSLARQAVPPPGIEGHWGIVREQNSGLVVLMPRSHRPPFKTAPVADSQRSPDPPLFTTSAREDSQRRWLPRRIPNR
jgi:hypothetical protein